MPSDLRRFSKGHVQRDGKKPGLLDPRRAQIWSRESGSWDYIEFDDALVEREAQKHTEKPEEAE